MFEVIAIDVMVIGGGTLLTLISATMFPPNTTRWWVSIPVTAIAFAGAAAIVCSLFERGSGSAPLVVMALSAACTLMCGAIAFLARGRAVASRLLWAAVVVAPFVLITPVALLLANGGL